MDALINFLNEPTGSTLAYVGIAIIYIATGVLEISRGRGRGNALWFIPGAVFLILAVLCHQRGTVKEADAGIVLAYLGIGAGLICAAWTTHSNGKIAWFVMGIGICFKLIGFILVYHAGLI